MTEESSSSGGSGPYCGNGVVDGDEECDDGEDNANTAACKLDCTEAFCGDTFVGPDEECDDSDGVNWNACTNWCRLPVCGDQIHSTGEGCDDGNEDDTDGCLSTCVSATCGDGVVQAGVEECDDGNVDDTDACTNVCANAACGDGIVQAGVEECDDGNADDADACLVSCIAAACGDGIVRAGVEQCDDGNGDDTDACPGNCLDASCGDGFLQAGLETCDDGNASDTDDCPTTCLPAGCGDGFTWAGVEECDDADQDDTDACLATCASATCGDGFVQAGIEDCDDANLVAADGCENDCTYTPDPCGPPGNVIYVDAAATGTGDGSSWANAYTTVWFAMQSAGVNDQLWIAEGEYRSVIANAPVALLTTCVDLYGGFEGDETALAQRPDPLTLTVFDGDFAQDDDISGFADNAWHVLAGTSVQNIHIDGLTIRGGRATGGGNDNNGGGIYLASSTGIALSRLTLEGNIATLGGGLYDNASTVGFVSGYFDGNSAVSGGGFYSTGATSSLTLSGTTFDGNAATNGGAGYTTSSAALTLGSSLLTNNTATHGGALYLGYGTMDVSTSTFQANAATQYGGAIRVEANGGITSCTFDSNTAGQRGGAVYRAGLTTSFGIITSQFLSNSTPNAGGNRGGALAIEDGSITQVQGGTFQGNSSQLGGAISASIHNYEWALFDGPIFTDNVAIDGGALYLISDDAFDETDYYVLNAAFIDNTASTASGDGGAVIASANTLVRAYSNHFEGNHAGGTGGAMRSAGILIAINNAFHANTADGNGGALYVTSAAGTPRLYSDSFYANSAGGSGGGVYLTGGAGATMHNTAMWGNGTDMSGAALATITYTCSEQFLSVAAGNVLLFADPFVVGTNGELFLDQTSACVDAGDDASADFDFTSYVDDWTDLTTASDGTLDVTPVDMGAHYPP